MLNSLKNWVEMLEATNPEGNFQVKLYIKYVGWILLGLLLVSLLVLVSTVWSMALVAIVGIIPAVLIMEVVRKAYIKSKERT